MLICLKYSLSTNIFLKISVINNHWIETRPADTCPQFVTVICFVTYSQYACHSTKHQFIPLLITSKCLSETCHWTSQHVYWLNKLSKHKSLHWQIVHTLMDVHKDERTQVALTDSSGTLKWSSIGPLDQGVHSLFHKIMWLGPAVRHKKGHFFWHMEVDTGCKVSMPQDKYDKACSHS